MKESARHLLKILADLYPAWATSLNKDYQHKKQVCFSYTSQLESHHSVEHIDKLKDWLCSTNNDQFKKFPPSPIEIKSLLRQFSKVSKTPTLLDFAKHEDKNTDQIVPMLAIKWKLSPFSHGKINREHLFHERNEHLKPYAMSLVKYITEAPAVVKTANDFVYLFSETCKKNPFMDKKYILEKMLSPQKRELLESRLGDINIENLLIFLKDTRVDETLYQILENNPENSIIASCQSQNIQ